MHNILITYKAHTPEALDQAQRLRGWLEGQGKVCHLIEAAGGEPSAKPGPGMKLPVHFDLVIVLGGDGTMLGVVRQMARNDLTNIPVLGVNLGGLGFMTAVSSEEMIPALERVLAGEFEAPPRMMLQAEVKRHNQIIVEYTALNDLVINKDALARIIELHLQAGPRHVTTLKADGLIVSTPTGSTAYNLSAGGPICHPSLDCILVTPICSFALSNRPLLLGPLTELRVTMGERTHQTTLTCDGQVGLELQTGDEIHILRSPQTIRIIQSPFKDYFEILRTKLRWG